jgi:hypothetical protein
MNWNAKHIPIFINARDLVSSLKRQVTWLLEANYDNLYILDNDSTYPPLLDYYASIRNEVAVVPLGANVGHKAIWDVDVLGRFGITTPYVYTDPDIVPFEECPHHVLEFFLEVLRAYPNKSKVGFGLSISDLPDHYQFKRKVIAWESQFWESRLTSTLYDAPIDTTFALYRPGTVHDYLAIRSGFPYLARHVPWYEDSDHPSDEQAYYVRHAIPGTNTWSGAALPDWLDAWTARRMQAVSECN